MKHFPNPKGTLTAILAMVMLASFASCTGKTPASDTDATDASVSTTTEITTAEITTVAETAYIDTLEKRDMGGREIIFYGQNSDDRQNFYSYYLTPIHIRANLRLIDEYDLEDPYELVLSGKWTADKLSEMAKDKYQDLNQNATADDDDFFGLIMDGTFGNALYTGAGLDTVSHEGGEYKLTLDSEQSVNLIEKYASLFGDRNQYMNDLNGSQSWDTDVFKAGNCIFQPSTILGTMDLRDMKDDFAILPIPKWDEAQTEYYTSCNTWLPSGIAVPKNCSIVDDLGLVLETMAYYSQEMVTPAVYEITLQGKVSRDDSSAKMLDIIYGGAAFDFVTAFNFANAGNILREMVTGDQQNFVSVYARIKKPAQAELNKVMSFAED